MAEELTRHVLASDGIAPETPVADGLRRHTWEEFAGTGLLWLANRTLHVFGWAIVIATDEHGGFVDTYPVRCNWRGFPPAREARGHARVGAWMEKTAATLRAEADTEN